MPPFLKIRRVGFISVCLLFETKVPVGIPVIQNKAEHPLEEIRHIEAEEKKFLHLGGMDRFMALYLFLLIFGQRIPRVLSHKDPSEKVDGNEAFKREDVVPKHFHTFPHVQIRAVDLFQGVMNAIIPLGKENIEKN